MCNSCRTCFIFYCMFYSTCDRSLSPDVVDGCQRLQFIQHIARLCPVDNCLARSTPVIWISCGSMRRCDRRALMAARKRKHMGGGAAGVLSRSTRGAGSSDMHHGMGVGALQGGPGGLWRWPTHNFGWVGHDAFGPTDGDNWPVCSLILAP